MKRRATPRMASRICRFLCVELNLGCGIAVASPAHNGSGIRELHHQCVALYDEFGADVAEYETVGALHQIDTVGAQQPHRFPHRVEGHKHLSIGGCTPLIAWATPQYPHTFSIRKMGSPL